MIIRDNDKEKIVTYELPLDIGTFCIERRSKISNRLDIIILYKDELKKINKFIGE